MTDDTLVHRKGATDDVLVREAADFLARSPRARFLAELWAALEELKPKWWTAKANIERWPITDRMAWLRDRPDIRQRIATELTGLPPNTARKKLPEFQAALIDEALEGGDVTHDRVEKAFTAEELALYAPPGALWAPVAEILKRGLEGERNLMARVLRLSLPAAPGARSLLAPLDVRLAIDPGTWQIRIPVGVRAAVDKERLSREASGKPFTTADELSIVGTDPIAENLGGRELMPLLLALDAKLRDGAPAQPEEQESEVAVTLRRPQKGFVLPPIRPIPPAPRAKLPSADEGFEDSGDLQSLPPPPPVIKLPPPRR